MNIFFLDTDPKLSAQYHCDKHVIKMLVEYTQLLSTTNRLYGYDEGYKITHKNHPMAIWTRDSLDNWMYLRLLSEYLYNEYKYRYGDKERLTYKVLKTLRVPAIESKGITKIPLCMPDIYKTGDVVESYRNYYKYDKYKIATWKKREVPYWYK